MMIQEQKIDNLQKIMEIISRQEYEEKIGRFRSSYLYRGIPNVNFHLLTSLYRNCGIKSFDIEKSILRNFTKYALIEDPQLASSVWRQLIIGQHHGLPTRLLDWTYSPPCCISFCHQWRATLPDGGK